MASCTPVNPANGATVTCSGAANPLAPAYAASADNLTVNVQPGGSLGVLLGLGGTAMSLTGNGTTLNNSGTIDPSLLGLLSLLSSGTVIGNPNLGSAIAGSTVSVNNQGVMKGTTGLLGLNLADLTGMALAVRNGAGGTTSLSNAGTVESSALLGVSLLGSDAPVIAAYGGGQISFTNTGTITGRTGFEPSAAGNAFVNAGTISGSVSMGTNSTNTFTAVSGSNVNNGGSLGLNLLGVLGINLDFAPTGQIDGGAGGNNTLVLQNAVVGPGSGTGGTVTYASSATYINFQHLIVNSGTWNLQGALVGTDAMLNGGLANFDNDANFGSAPIIANGGAIGASTGGATLGKAITLNAGGLIAQADNNFTLSGALSGFGALTKNGSGTLTLTGPGSYSGGTVVTAGTFALGGGGTLPANGMVNLQGAGSALDLSGAIANQTIGALVGAPGSTINLGARTLTLGDGSSTTFAGIIGGTGSIAKQGLGTLTLTAPSIYSGGTTISAGEIFAAGNGALGTGPVIVNGGTLAGAVTLPNSLALSSGFVVPGDGVAVNQTLTVASYAQTAGTLTINADGGTGQNSMLGVQGAAMLGGTLHINFATAPAPGQLYTVVTALSVSGTFSGITSSSLPSGFALSPIYGPGSVQILIVGPATHFGIVAPGSATAGTAFAFTVTALDSGGNTATAYSGTVHFTSSDGTALLPADATLSNGVGTFNATLKTAGGQTLTATDTVTGSITGSASITVGKAATTTALTAVPATTSYGQSVTLTAAVSLPPGNTGTATGAVDFSDSGVAIPGCSGVTVDASGNATCTTASLAAGVHSLRADYLGDGNTGTSFGTLQYTVANATPAMTLTAAPNPASAGQAVVLTATLSNSGSPATPTGSVEFFDGTTSLGSVALDGNGVAVLTLSSLAQGTHALSAVYAGGGGFASASAQLSLVVSAPPVPTPALSEWMLVLFATLMVAVGVRVMRER